MVINMKRLQIEEVRKANTELEELTNIFVRWGNNLNNGQKVSETLSAFELGGITGSSAEVVGKIPYDGESSTYDGIHDDFSPGEYLRDLIRKYQNE